MSIVRFLDQMLRIVVSGDDHWSVSVSTTRDGDELRMVA